MAQLNHLVKKLLNENCRSEMLGEKKQICRNACYNAASLPIVIGRHFSGKSGQDF